MTLFAPFIYNATVIDVHDGDTFNVKVDWGFHRYDEPVPIRLRGAAARELTDPGGPEARDNLAALLPPGAQVILQTAKPDKFNPRWDAQVTYLTADGAVHDLVTDLIAAGYAVAWDGKGTQPKPPWPIPTT